MTSLVLDRLVPHYWNLLRPYNHQDDYAEILLHSVFCKWDDDLYQTLIGSDPSMTRPKDYALSITILEKWIPYWFIQQQEQVLSLWQETNGYSCENRLGIH